MARGPGVAPGRDHAAVPGHDRPRHAAPGERREGGVSVSVWSQRILHSGKPQNCQSRSNVMCQSFIPGNVRGPSLKMSLLHNEISQLLSMLWVNHDDGRQPTKYHWLHITGARWRSPGNIALAWRGCGSLYGPLKLRKFQLYTIINFLRYFYKPRSRNKVGMDDEVWVTPTWGPGEVKRPLTGEQFMIWSEVGPRLSRAEQARPHHNPQRKRNGWRPGLQKMELAP